MIHVIFIPIKAFSEPLSSMDVIFLNLSPSWTLLWIKVLDKQRDEHSHAKAPVPPMKCWNVVEKITDFSAWLTVLSFARKTNCIWIEIEFDITFGSTGIISSLICTWHNVVSHLLGPGFFLLLSTTKPCSTSSTVKWALKKENTHGQ